MTIAWIALPFFIGFSIYLFPKWSRHLALAVSLVSLAYGLYRVLMPTPQTLELLDSFGVTLIVDGLSGFFVLTNAVVTTAVIIYCWQQGKSAFFYTQTIILLGSVNSAFICADFISLYVALEVISIAAFLLIAYPRSNRSIWVGLRYLFVSNTAMLFYLIGAVLVYQANESFAFEGLGTAPPEALALIFLGLLTKGGIFVSGLWLPLTHAEAQTPVSALLSGAVITVGSFPLVRCSLLLPEVQPILTSFSMATAVLGVVYAMVESDAKRLLAFSTVSQVGFVLAAPPAAGFYALTHGLAKAALFLLAGNLPSRDLRALRSQPLPFPVGMAIALAGLSIAGLPFLSGFEAKTLLLQNTEAVPGLVLNLAAVGTVIAMAKLVMVPWQPPQGFLKNTGLSTSVWLALGLLLVGLLVANVGYPSLYTLENVGKALLTIGAGGLIYWFAVRRIVLQLPRAWEKLEHLIGAMSLILTALFWMVLA